MSGGAGEERTGDLSSSPAWSATGLLEETALSVHGIL